MENKRSNPLTAIASMSKLNKIFLSLIVLSIFTGIGSGYVFAANAKSGIGPTSPTDLINEKPKSAAQDNRTFRDFAEGKVTKKPEPKKGADYSEGTHLLIRDAGVPVALTSSVVDLSLYEDKKVKVYGETQKALKEGWLMDVGRVEEIN